MTINHQTSQISSLGIVGAGNMGASIAVAMTQLGIPVIIMDNCSVALESGLARIEKMFTSLDKRLDSQEKSLEIAKQRKLIEPVSKYDDLKNVDLVIEAVNEDIEIKRSVLQNLDKTCQPQTIIATNTSSLSISQLASFTNRPKQIIGLHFFNPAHIMSLVEVIPGLNTAESVTEISMDIVRKLHKLPVKVQECASFLVNRLLSRYLNEAIYILQTDLADVKTIDEAACELLMPIGPLQLRDMNGLDIGLSVARFNYNEYGERFQFPDLLETMVDRKMLGIKTLAGFYAYKQDERKPIGINPDLDNLLKISQPSQTGTTLAKFEPIQLFLPMINEAFLALQENIVAPSDLDPALKAALGMRKGPIEFAFEFGLENCLKKIETLFHAYGERFRPAPLLKRYVWAGKNCL